MRISSARRSIWASSSALSCSSCGELAGQHDAQLGAHFVAQLGVALGLRGLALQRIHLARDFFEDVVDAGQVLLGVFEAGFRKALPGLELGDAGGLFDNGAAVGGRLLRIWPMRPCSMMA